MNIPIECQKCGATGEVLRVTANLQCRCGSRDLDLWDGVPKSAASGGTGWNQSRPDPDANWSDYVGPPAGRNPYIDHKNDADANNVCPACNGTGHDSRASGGGYDETSCRNCHGTGHVTYSGQSHGPTNDAHVPQGPPLGAASRTGKVAFGPEHVQKYMDWAKSQKHDPDEVSTLKNYEKQPDVSRAHTNHIADQLYIGGGDQDWRKSSARVAVPGVKSNKLVTAGQGDKIMRMAAKIVETNSGLSTQEAFELARRAVASFPEDGDK